MDHLCQSVCEEKMDNSLQSENFTLQYRCGTCLIKFETVCKLHCHLKTHVDSVSYYFEYLTKTAYPRYDNKNSGTQTLALELLMEDLFENAVTRDKTESKLFKKKINVHKKKPEISVHRRKHGKNQIENKEKVQEMEKEVDGSKALLPFEYSIDSKDKFQDGHAEHISRGLEEGINQPGNTSNDLKGLDTNSEGAPRQIEITNDLIEAKEESIDFGDDDTDSRLVFEENATTEMICEDRGKVDQKYVEELQIATEDMGVNINDTENTYKEVSLTADHEATINKKIKKRKRREYSKRAIACENEISEKNGLKLECSKTLQVKKFVCLRCNQKFPKAKDLITHKKQVHPRVWKCEPCRVSFLNYKDLTDHRTSIHNNNIYKCNTCDAILCNPLSWKRHTVMLHHESTTYENSCKECRKLFVSFKQLERHKKEVHERSYTYICEICGFSTFLRHCFLDHRRKMHGGKIYTCQQCPFKTLKLHTFKRHNYLEHAGEDTVKVKVCQICGITCRGASVLNRHMLVHTGEARYKCEVCGTKFKQGSTLQRHMDMHAQRKQFKCPYCFKEFIQKSNCTAHIRQHTGEKPYTCDVCDESFTHNVSRKNHMLKKHNIKIGMSKQ